MAAKRSADAWVDDYLEGQKKESKPDKLPTLEDLLSIKRKIDEIVARSPKGKFSAKDWRRLKSLDYAYQKQAAIYSNLGNRLKKPDIEGGVMIRDPRFRRFRK